MEAKYSKYLLFKVMSNSPEESIAKAIAQVAINGYSDQQGWSSKYDEEHKPIQFFMAWLVLSSSLRYPACLLKQQVIVAMTEKKWWNYILNTKKVMLDFRVGS